MRYFGIIICGWVIICQLSIGIVFPDYYDKFYTFSSLIWRIGANKHAEKLDKHTVFWKAESPQAEKL